MKRRHGIRGLVSGCRALLLVFVLAVPAMLEAQHTAPAEAQLAFEVATIKVVDPHTITGIELRIYPGGRLVVRAHRLAMLIAEAFNIPEQDIVGGAESVMQGWYDVEGKPAEGLRAVMPGSEYSAQSIQDARIRSMLQTLLIERFHLKFHIASQPGTVYQLRRSGGPLRLKPVEVNSQVLAADKARDTSDMNNMLNLTSGMPVELHKTTIPQLASLLSKDQRAPVIDQTDLPGFYNFKSKRLVTNEDFQNGDLSHVLLDTTSEMGLKLVKAKGVIEKFVIDNVDPVAAN